MFVAFCSSIVYNCITSLVVFDFDSAENSLLSHSAFNSLTAKELPQQVIEIVIGSILRILRVSIIIGVLI